MKPLIAGLDEVGMGCVAGPLVVVVTAFEEDATPIEGVTDSKKLTKKKRETLAPQVMEACSFFGFGWAPVQRIEQDGLGEAWQYAARMALQSAPEFKDLIVDGTRPVKGYLGSQRCETKGDARFWEVGAASILAKVFRDREMEYFSDTYPHYGWETNAGYGTEHHMAAVIKYGPTPLHRVSFLEKQLAKRV